MTSEIKVNNIKKASGSTITIGESGDTISLATGASQSGFGRSGTVDWQTSSIKTATFTAVSGQGFFANTTGGAFNMNLPAGSAGAIVSVADYAETFDSNNLTIVPNGSEKIGSLNQNAVLNTKGQSVTLVYVDSTQGWINTMDSTSNVRGIPPFIVATGGTIKTSGNFKTHIFTSPGTFQVTNGGGPSGSNTVDYFVVAGGGGGAFGQGPDGGGGAGAGGFRVSNSVGCVPAPTMSPLISPTGLPVTVTSYPVTVGAGGAGAPSQGSGTKGSDSIFTGSSTITSTGGGFGEFGGTPSPGGSGGGSHQGAGGSGNTPPVSPSQGFPGGSSGPNPDGSAPQTPNSGGGGGASAGGGGGSTPKAGNGGDGSFIAETFIGGCAPSFGTPGPVSSTRYFAGGGGGGPSPSRGSQSASVGGAGGGGGNPASSAQSGTANTGGGGAGNEAFTGGSGGSGIVMIRYKFQ